MERAEGFAAPDGFIGLGGKAACAFGIQGDDGVEGGVEGGDAGEERLDKLEGGGLTGADGSGGLGAGEGGEIGGWGCVHGVGTKDDYISDWG